MANKLVQEFTDANFKKEVLSEPLVLVDFWASWCQPCRAIAPVIEKLATAYKGRVKVGKVDVDANQKVSMTYSVSSIPTLLIFKGGNVVGQIVGVVPQAKLEEALKKHL